MQARKRHFDASFLGVASLLMNGPATDVVAVFSQIGQMAEVSEGPRHADRTIAAQAFEQLLERFVSRHVGVTAKRHRELANLLDQLKGGGAFLLANDIAQGSAQQADVI